MRAAAVLASALALVTASTSRAAADKPAEAAVGKAAPAFLLRTPDGAAIRLEDYAYPGPEKKRAKKQVVVLDFFRTDCGPCRAAMPDLKAFYAEYKAKGVELILVALLEPEDGRAKLDAFLAEQSLPFPVVVDATDHVAKKYLGVPPSKLPATFLVDRAGVIQQARFGGKGTLASDFGAALGKALAAEAK